MADPSSSRSELVNLDGLQGPPTFVQLRAPAPGGSAGRKVGIATVGLAIVGLAFVVAVGWWTADRLTVEPAAAVATEAAPNPSQGPNQRRIQTPTPQPAPADLYPELADLATDAALLSPAWTAESLMEWVSPFDPSAAAREARAGATNAGTPGRDMTPTAYYEVSVRLAKGDTIGGALRKRGFAAEAVADAVAALAPHVNLKRLPIGLVMTVRVRPAEEEAAPPVLQALTVLPDARKEVTVARDRAGNYAVERR